MDTYEATKVVMSRIKDLDPENATKIMGYILLQDQGEREMIRLAFGPETLLLSYITQAKLYLGIPSTNPSSNPPTPLSNSMRPFLQTSPRVVIPTDSFHLGGGSGNPSPTAAAFQRANPRPFSYAAALNNGANNGISSSSSSSNGGLGNEYGHHVPYLDDSFVDPVMSPSGRSDSLVFPYGEDAGGVQSPHPHPFHRRSCSVNDAAFLANLEEGGCVGNGWRPCMYFARGFCKNGGSCKFSHGEFGEGVEVGSPNKSVSVFDELFRIKALQQQRFAAMATAGGHHPFAYSKCTDLMTENPRFDRSELSQMLAGANSSSRQIYLTFPADSTFKEEDVSNYFSMFGPVQDVRIPYQQKRMFGFVTFLYAETVKLILAKGNPHFVCDSRVLVKPYKEKGKIPDKKQLHLERGDYSTCLSPLSPSALESRDHIDLPFGSRMLLNAQEMMLRKKLEQEAELQHAIELQSRRMMSLKLIDLKNQHSNHHFLPGLRAPISSPRQAQPQTTENLNPSSDNANQENPKGFDGSREGAKSPPVATDYKLFERTESLSNKLQLSNNNEDYVFSESLEHILPDNLFASPTKLAAEQKSAFSQASASCTDDSSSVPAPMSSAPNNIAFLESWYLQTPSH